MVDTLAPILIGIDPGFDRLGWAVARVAPGVKISILDYGCITTSKTEDIFIRFKQLFLELEKILEKYQPTYAAIESLFFLNNAKTAMRVSEARGLVISSLIQHTCQITEYTPLQIKQAVTGFGKAEKSAVEKMVRLQLKITEPKILDDTMDALAVLLTHSTQIQIKKRIA